MSKKRKYRPRPVKLNACMAAMERNKILKKPVTSEFTGDLEIAVLSAFDMVTRGQGTSDQWDVLANCLNSGWLLAKAGLGAEAREAFNSAHEAMNRMVPNYRATGRLEWQSNDDQMTVKYALDLWVEQLKIITIGELDASMQVVEREYWKHREPEVA